MPLTSLVHRSRKFPVQSITPFFTKNNYVVNHMFTGPCIMLIVGCKYVHPQELATYLLSYFMGCIALVRCVLVLRCGLAGVVWYPDAG